VLFARERGMQHQRSVGELENRFGLESVRFGHSTLRKCATGGPKGLVRNPTPIGAYGFRARDRVARPIVQVHNENDGVQRDSPEKP
jgi:hypothetical protein